MLKCLCPGEAWEATGLCVSDFAVNTPVRISGVRDDRVESHGAFGAYCLISLVNDS